MLNRLKIEKLFSLYDYDIDLTNADGSMVKFITAPNGYGKTTILIITRSTGSIAITVMQKRKKPSTPLTKAVIAQCVTNR